MLALAHKIQQAMTEELSVTVRSRRGGMGSRERELHNCWT
jgi:hypothetical protein